MFSDRGIGTRIAVAKTEASIDKLMKELAGYEFAKSKTVKRLRSRAKLRILELKSKKKES